MSAKRLAPMTTTSVPFLDLKSHHLPLMGELKSAVNEVIESGAFAGGPYVAAFEEEFAAFCESRHCMGLGSGTDALWLSLVALGVGPGDEVITVPSTFMATAEAISCCGASPVFVDVDPKHYTMDPSALQCALTPRTKAIIPVHLFGQAADMDPILQFAKKHGLAVIEDAAQAHGTKYKERKIGSLGDTGCFSFYPGKNLGAFGEAGAVVTNRIELQEKIKILRDHGQARKYDHAEVGWNCRMDGIQAAVLSVKLRRLQWSNERRDQHARQYDEALKEVPGIVTPARADYSSHIYHIYAIRVAGRKEVMRSLTENGIGCGIHYPVPVHLQAAYRYLGYKKGDFPVAEQIADEFISLPMFPELTEAQIERVIRCTANAVSPSRTR